MNAGDFGVDLRSTWTTTYDISTFSCHSVPILLGIDPESDQ